MSDYNRQNNSHRGRPGGFTRRTDGFRRDRPDRPLFDAVCSKCGKECRVPFQPTGEKPVYCSDCFRQTDDHKSSRPSYRSEFRTNRGGDRDNYEAQFNALNNKLDRIIELLNPEKILTEN